MHTICQIHPHTPSHPQYILKYLLPMYHTYMIHTPHMYHIVMHIYTTHCFIYSVVFPPLEIYFSLWQALSILFFLISYFNDFIVILSIQLRL